MKFHTISGSINDAIVYIWLFGFLSDVGFMTCCLFSPAKWLISNYRFSENTMKSKRTKTMPKIANLTVIFTTLGIIWLQGLVGPIAAETLNDRSQKKEVKHNRLINESSPYLLQHASNPVDWYPWGEEAFAKAKKENKPVFLSIGYSTCHWCHVMERESFADEEVAVLLNKYFVAVKVDREERPDIDQVYMAVTQTMTGRGGWPNNVFLTPDTIVKMF
jgi:thiol:disulfide interchange protein